MAATEIQLVDVLVLPVGNFASDLDPALKQLQAERDENTCRKDLCVAEGVAMAGGSL